MSRAALAGLALLAGGCASRHAYMGVALDAGTDPTLRALAVEASDGAAQAQLALGRRFEDGLGVAADPNRACRLYEAAGATTGGTIFVYSPPIGREKTGRIIPITTPVRHGLPVATERLASLAYRASIAERARSACLRRHR